MSHESKTFPWYALQVRPRYERIVASALVTKGFEGFLPIYRNKSRWTDRIKEIELPLFPGYVFCRFEANRRLPIVTTPGVLRIVGAGKALLAVDDAEIAALQSIVISRLQAEPWPYLCAGERVIIDRGALAGVEGIVIDAKDNARLVVSVSLLQRSVAVEIDESWVSPASGSLLKSQTASSN